jgi:hypothetical protein
VAPQAKARSRLPSRNVVVAVVAAAAVEAAAASAVRRFPPAPTW